MNKLTKTEALAILTTPNLETFIGTENTVYLQYDSPQYMEIPVGKVSDETLKSLKENHNLVQRDQTGVLVIKK